MLNNRRKWTTSNALNLVFLLLVLTSWGQSNHNSRPAYKFNHLNQTLNNYRVSCLLQDSYGYMWIGTFSGLHRYDGTDIELYLSSKDTTSINNNRIGEIFEDQDRNLWIGTAKGLCRFNRDLNNFVQYLPKSNIVNPTDPRPNWVGGIVQDSRGRVWVGSQREGLFLWDKKNDQFVPILNNGKNKIPTTFVTALHTRNNYLWIGTGDKGLFQYNLDTEEVIQISYIKEKSSSNYISDLLLDNLNRLWIATPNEGLYKLDLTKKPFHSQHYMPDKQDPTSLKNTVVTSLGTDHLNHIWICNENGGLNLYNEKDDSFFHFLQDPKDPYSISNNAIWSVYEDRQHRLWVGSALEGIDIVDEYYYKFDYYFKTNGNNMSNNVARGFAEDHDGNIWIATDGGGINYFDRENSRFTSFKKVENNPKSLQSDAALTLCVKGDKMLIGTWQGGINLFDLKTKTPMGRILANENSLNNVFELSFDNDSLLWICTYYGGLNQYNFTTKELKIFRNDPHDPKSIGSNITSTMLLDSKNRIWVGSEDNGLNLLTNSIGEFKRFEHHIDDSNSLPSSRVNDIFEDSYQQIWVCTEGGLARLNEVEGTFTVFGIQDGLPTENIKSIVEDNNNMLWIGTTKGISRFNPKTRHFRNYDKSDGLQHGEFLRHSVFKTSSGELLFGGTNGFNLFKPDSVKDNPFLPPVEITGLKIFNQTVKIGTPPLKKDIRMTQEIEIKYNQSVFSIEYAALNYTHNEKCQYEFMLEGFDKNWIKVGDQRMATYTNLDPGNYIFKVRATNNDGILNKKYRSLKITITPPIWGTIWFRILALIFVAGLIYFLATYRLRRLNRMNSALEQKVNERTHALSAALEETQSQKSHIQDINKELEKTHEELRVINEELDKKVHDRTSELLKANHELDRFVYSASHDLSAPLKSILGLIGLARYENKMPDMSEHLNRMETSVQKLDNVIQSLTQFSRNFGQETKTELFYFDDIIEEVLNDIRYAYYADNIKLIKNYDQKEKIITDYLRLKIILSNLISNAFKYHDEEKNDSYVEIKFSQSNQLYNIEVKDNGIGLKRGTQEDIFKMFFRGTTLSTGSGLGLYIVKETINKLNGQIEVHSQHSKLTIFSITLPAGKETQ